MQLTGDELKNRLTKEHYNLLRLNNMERGQIYNFSEGVYWRYFAKEEIEIKVKDYEKSIAVNDFLIKNIENQLKDEFGYDIKQDKDNSK